MMSEISLAFLLFIFLFMFFSIHLFLDMKTKGKGIFKRGGNEVGQRLSHHAFYGIILSTSVFWIIFFLTPASIFLGIYGSTLGIFTLSFLKSCLTQSIGSSLMILGILIADWGRILRGAMAPSTFRLPENFRFTTHGAYGIVRHPMYLSYYLMFAGLFLLTANVLLLLCLVGYPSYYIAAIEEERFLEERYSKYSAYKAHVGMMLPKL